MKNVQKIDLGLTGYDELFANDEERKVNKLPRIFDIPISEIDDFPDHPFKVKIDEDMDQLVQSIKERGIITPVTLRPKEDGRYEIVSGHRRKKACELAGLDTVKAEVREMSRDEAIILMVESNLQRSTIDDTNINYPVMWTPNNPNYYLKHSFEKEYSDYGVPYIDEDCVMGESNNYVIYGHHMKNETMFHDLCNYASKDFYDEHPTIKFDTLFGFGEYQIVAVFRFDTNNDTFRYNQFTDMDEEHFKNFMNSVHLRQLYDTGVDAEYGDHLITLSTCEYTYTNGRFVVVAKKV